jgi:hypothetical protein
VDGVRDRLTRRCAVQDRFADLLRDVLDQRAALDDVEYLRAAADAQRRRARVDEPARDGQLQVIALVIDAVVQLVHASGIALRVDVAASGEHERIDHLERLLPVRFAGRDQQRDAAGAADRIDVLAGQAETAIGAAAVGAQADQGRLSSRHG